MKKKLRKNSSKSVLLMTFSGMPTSINYFYPDAGLSYLASKFHETGQSVKIYDFNNYCFYTQVIEKFNKAKRSSCSKKITSKEYCNIALQLIIKELKPIVHNFSLLGIKIWTGESLKIIPKLIGELKEENPEIELAAGGPILNFYKDDLNIFLKNSSIDYIVLDGEENSFIESFSTETISLDNISVLPVYDKDVYININKGKIPVYLIPDSRGCSNKCPFCNHSLLKKKLFGSDEVLRQITYIKNKYNGKLFRLSGSCPNSNFLHELSNKLIDNNVEVFWSSFTSYNTLKKIDFKLLKASGFSSFLMGIESTNTPILSKFFNKKIDFNNVEFLLKEAVKNKIYPNISIVPVEYMNEVEVQIWSTFPINIGVSTFYPIVYPKTDWWVDGIKFDISIQDKDQYLKYLLYSDYSSEDLHKSNLILNGKSSLELIQVQKKWNSYLLEKSFDLSNTDDIALIPVALGVDPKTFFRKQYSVINSIANIDALNFFDQVKGLINGL